MPLSESELQTIHQALKRCSPETVEAALAFRNDGDTSKIPTIVYGILERFMPAESAGKLKNASDDTRLIDDLGVDSLTMLEVVLAIEEVLGIRIENEELREISTLGQVKAFIAKRIAEGPATSSDAPAPGTVKMTKADLLLTLPQQPPFLFIDEAVVTTEGVTGSYRVTGEEYFLEGHFKDNPVFPASIVFEALGQAACAWILKNTEAAAAGHSEVVFASMGSAHFYKRAVPGDTLQFTLNLRRLREPLAIFSGEVSVKGERLAAVEDLMLAFGEGASAHLNGVASEVPAPTQAAA
ncbi:MAG: phosphopantetheine-binding protein [Verrucomicrobiia bacterium]